MRIVFISADIWGIVVLVPLYWLVDLTDIHLCRSTGVLLRLPIRGYGLANRFSRHRFEPNAVAAIDGSGHYREDRLRSDGGHDAQRRATFIEGHTRRRAGFTVGNPFYPGASRNSDIESDLAASYCAVELSVIRKTPPPRVPA